MHWLVFAALNLLISLAWKVSLFVWICFVFVFFICIVSHQYLKFHRWKCKLWGSLFSPDAMVNRVFCIPLKKGFLLKTSNELLFLLLKKFFLIELNLFNLVLTLHSELTELRINLPCSYHLLKSKTIIWPMITTLYSV